MQVQVSLMPNLSPVKRPLFSPVKRAEAMAQLKQRMENLQTRMKTAVETTDRVVGQQAEMRNIAVQIQRDHGTRSLVVKQEERKLVKVEQMGKDIGAAHPLISFTLGSMRDIWNRLSFVAADIRKDQLDIAAKLNVVGQQQQVMQQQALAIQKGGVSIRQNLVAAAEKVDRIQQYATQIKADHVTIAMHSAQIEEKQEELKESVKKLQEMQNETKTTESVKNENQTPEVVTGFWSGLIQKVMEYASWFFSVVASVLVGEGVDLQKWLASKQMQTFYTAMNHPASWVILGIIACAAIRNAAFTMICASFECSLFYYRWQQQTPKEMAAPV